MLFDVTIIGSGIAGLSYSLKLSDYFRKNDPNKKICIVTKGEEEETNTKYAQGGVAVVMDFFRDSYEKHMKDTLRAGDELSDPEIVEMVIKDGPARIFEIIEWGTEFDRKESGEFDLAKEGGHSESRVLHHKDVTGFEIEQKLLRQIHSMPNVVLLNHHYAIDLLTQHHLGIHLPKKSPDIECYGVYVMNKKTNHIEKILSKITVLATGGLGQVYYNTTNPLIATGDGVAMAYRAGAVIENMEFIQFHPTALYYPGIRPSFLISEAVRGFGAILKTNNGEEFMHKYDERGSLAPRDIVARAIDREMKKLGHEHVSLDCRHLDQHKFSEKFPKIYQKLISLGINPAEKMIPVVPTAHYACGGVKTDKHGQTSIKNLFAIGEVASTGLHGANRLASNSLLEALVFAHNCFEKTIELIDSLNFKQNIPDWNAEGTTEPREMVLITHKIKELQMLMSDYVSIVRSFKRLEEAMKRLRILNDETETLYNMETLSPQLCELRNLVTVGYLITKAAMERKENKGLHFNVDLEKNNSI
ncbi:MAG TPA: L-aspartate oxidase [Bacteroidia bacterium]|nr:L-aspartate oxidase [Bacteroidia bacterium]HRS57739.1 L-aspartate oxidase [Bacteroidia bacterium]HRU67046.1 L-aspartate oxidase [Bacteroidia bacterium]